MPILGTTVQTGSTEFAENRQCMESLVHTLRERKSQAALGGSERSRKKHTDRGKLLVRDRIDLVTDEDTPFLELSELAAHEMYKGACPWPLGWLGWYITVII